MSNYLVTIVGIAILLAGLLCYGIWWIVNSILPQLPSGPFTVDPTPIFGVAIVVGIIIIIVGVLIQIFLRD